MWIYLQHKACNLVREQVDVAGFGPIEDVPELTAQQTTEFNDLINIAKAAPDAERTAAYVRT